ncbi:cupin domain-containing protein [Saccharothrix stipae]
MVDLVAAELDGPHSLRVNRRSTKVYYVERGSVEFTVSGQTRTVADGGAVLVRPGEPHRLVGDKARILIICSPSFDFTDEEVLG